MDCRDEVTSVDAAQRLSHQDGGGSGEGAADDSNLFAYIDRDQVFGLNLADPETAKHPIKPWDKRLDTELSAESLFLADEDGALFVLTIPFTTNVRLKSILLNPGRGDFAPRVRSKACMTML